MTGQITVRFYEELNDFLPEEKRKVSISYNFSQTSSVKDIIESLGVPHTEIDLILVNSESVDFSYKVKDQDYISVYPVFEALDITPVTHLHARPLRDTKFVLDVHLGRLAAYLRMLGFDTLYRNNYHDDELAMISVNEQRILLTCDRKLLMRKIITHGYYVRSRQPGEQLQEVVRYFDLSSSQKPFTRCISCNSKIKSVAKSAIQQHLPPRTSMLHDEFWQCTNCNKIYWKGSHYQRMLERINALNQPQLEV